MNSCSIFGDSNADHQLNVPEVQKYKSVSFFSVFDVKPILVWFSDFRFYNIMLHSDRHINVAEMQSWDLSKIFEVSDLFYWQPGLSLGKNFKYTFLNMLYQLNTQ